MADCVVVRLTLYPDHSLVAMSGCSTQIKLGLPATGGSSQRIAVHLDWTRVRGCGSIPSPGERRVAVRARPRRRSSSCRRPVGRQESAAAPRSARRTVRTSGRHDHVCRRGRRKKARRTRECAARMRSCEAGFGRTRMIPILWASPGRAATQSASSSQYFATAIGRMP